VERILCVIIDGQSNLERILHSPTGNGMGPPRPPRSVGSVIEIGWPKATEAFGPSAGTGSMMYIPAGMHPAWRRLANSLLCITTTIPQAPQASPLQNPAEKDLLERQQEMSSRMANSTDNKWKSNFYMLEDKNVTHFTISEIAAFLNKDSKTVRRGYKGRVGVHHDPNPETRNKRAYTPVRIPAAMFRADYAKSRGLD
jgi:hypothetical protein